MKMSQGFLRMLIGTSPFIALAIYIVPAIAWYKFDRRVRVSQHIDPHAKKQTARVVFWGTFASGAYMVISQLIGTFVLPDNPEQLTLGTLLCSFSVYAGGLSILALWGFRARCAGWEKKFTERNQCKH